MTRPKDPCRTESCGCRDDRRLSRRDFLTVAGGTAFAAGAPRLPVVAGPFGPQDRSDHFVPADKKLDPAWVRALFERGEPTWYAGDELETIGMPIGGICAGQLYLTGDGRLVNWDVFNQFTNTGYGQVNYEVGRGPTERVQNVREIVEAPAFEQGCALSVRRGRDTWTRALDRRGFAGVRFCGEYPIARIEFPDAELPVTVALEAFSPFVPLDARDSGLPATLLRYTVENRSDAEVEVTLAGWLENAVCPHSGPARFAGRMLRRNRVIADRELTALACGARPLELDVDGPDRPPIVFADFEGGSYGDWQVEGAAFGKAPASGTLEGQQPVSGHAGEGLVNTFLGGDGPHGRLVSPRFRIERPFVSFLIGGGAHADETCVNLIVDGAVARTATGRNRELLEPCDFYVRDLIGRTARIEIVDGASGPWGHVNVDQIEFRDRPMAADAADLRAQADWGTMCLALLGGGEDSGERLASAALPDGELPAALFGRGGLVRAEHRAAVERPLPRGPRGAVGERFTLEPGARRDVVFTVSWRMPNLRRGATWVGNDYAGRFANAPAVARYVARNLERLAGHTRRWHATYYDSTLPRWLLDRLHSTVANLATSTCQRWRNGRFWAWEGGGCCHGTCGHVWNYAQGLARLFPELERSAREMQDFAPGVGFDPETGAIAFRGEGWGRWAGDSQAGYVLKAYREHQTSPRGDFLARNWARIRQATGFLIDQDRGEAEPEPAADGLIEGRQHNTYDIDYFGANTMVGSLYLGALRAAEQMAREVGDDAFAQRCREIFASGSRLSVERLFDGEYFVQQVDLEAHPEWQYGDGCLADQLFGQSWAHQVGLGDLYPRDAVRRALRSIWKYCWAPDVGPQNRAHAPERWFARPGEAGLLTCTWPKSPHLGKRSTRYRDEVWTGIEYQVAAHMAWEGMLTEALAICRAIHERYHPRKHNPWNEIECGDHYARALASWGVLIALGGFSYHGPAGHIGFAPRITPEDFRCAFTAAEGWGRIGQQRAENAQTDVVEVAWGRVRVKELAFELPDGRELARATVRVGGIDVPADAEQDGRAVRVVLHTEAVVNEGSAIEARLELA